MYSNYNTQQNKINLYNNNVINNYPKRVKYHFDIYLEQLFKPHIKDTNTRTNLNILMVAEKPSIAKTIAESLSNNFKKINNCSKICPIYSFNYGFFNNNANIITTSVAGHLFEKEFSRNNNANNNPIYLFETEVIEKYTNPKNNIQKQLQNISKGIDIVVLWLDNDREGENICYEVLEIIYQNLKIHSFRQVYRAVFSSLAQKDIQYSMNNVNFPPDILKSLSVECRQEIDLKLGISFSRLQSSYLKDNFINLSQSGMISYGPCQMPTLNFCYKRLEEINSFTPKQYFKIQAEFNYQNKFLTFKSDNKYNNKGEVDKVVKKSEVKINILNTKTEKKVFPKPNGINTVNLLKTCSSVFGIGPHRALQIAEHLYLSGYITYPRTESTQFPSNFDYYSIVNALKSNYHDNDVRNYCSELKVTKPNSGKDCGDHPPITPTSKIPKGLSGDDSKIYNYILKVFLANISGNCNYEESKVQVQLNNITFSYTGYKVIDKGYLEILPNSKFTQKLVNLCVSEPKKLEFTKFIVKDKLTKKPTYLSEKDLLGMMEQYSIGTDASMATHIKNINDREYVKTTEARQLVPTDLGSSLIKSYLKIDEDLINPNLRMNMEHMISEIEAGTKRYDQVLFELLTIFRNKYSYFENNISKMNEEIGKKIESKDAVIQKDGKLFIKCGTCKKYTDLYESINKIKCKNCDILYNLPDNHKVKLASETCNRDKFEIVNVFKYDLYKENCSFKVCVKCYNDNEGLNNNPLMKCLGCNKSNIYLAQSKNNLFGVCSNTKGCNSGYKFKNNIKQINTNISTKCDKCAYNNYQIKYDDNKTLTVCVSCERNNVIEGQRISNIFISNINMVKHKKPKKGKKMKSKK